MAIRGPKPNKVTVDGTTVVVRAGSGIVGPKGDTGATGAQGSAGPAGSAATIAVQSTTTLAAGAAATVVNVGSSSAAQLAFGIPQGAQGSAGPAGSAATITVGTVTSGTAPAVTNSGTSSAAILNFTLQKGDTGTAGTNGDWSTAQTLNSQGTAYTLAASDAGKLIVFTGGSAVNCTIGTAVAMSAGQRVDVLQTGAGQVTFVASSTTVNGTPGLKLRAQYSAATILCIASNTYVVLGDLSA